MTRCTECGQFSHGPLCATHVELKEEVRVRRSTEAALESRGLEVNRLRSEIAAQRRYTVVPVGVYRDLTWTEAVAKAEKLYAEGHVFLEIRDERANVIRKYSRDPETKLKVVA